MALDVEVAVESYIERHEQGLSYLADELARQSRILQRTLREQGLALQQTTARARAAEELASIATLVAGLAHEIGTPMSVIQGHAKLLLGLMVCTGIVADHGGRIDVKSESGMGTEFTIALRPAGAPR
jgi:signal transduction histidine kinase